MKCLGSEIGVTIIRHQCFNDQISCLEEILSDQGL